VATNVFELKINTLNIRIVIYIKIIYYYYYYYILRLLAKRYEKLLAIRLGKPLIDKNPRHPSFAPFLCSSLLINDRQYYYMLYSL
jgi:hypothetical protein